MTKLSALLSEDLIHPLKITGDVMVTADHHIPFIDEQWHYFMLNMAKKFELKQIILAGDFLDEYCYGWVSGFKAQRRVEDYSFSKEKAVAKRILTEYLNQFSKVYWIPGGHDERILKAVNRTLDSSDLITLLTGKDDLIGKRIFITNHNWCEVNGKWRIYHPLKYGRKQLTKAEQYWVKHPEYNIITAHIHRANIGFTSSEVPKIVCDLGVMADFRKVPWTAFQEGDYPSWRKGFVILKNNYPIPFFEGMVDKKFWQNVKI